MCTSVEASIAVGGVLALALSASGCDPGDRAGSAAAPPPVETVVQADTGFYQELSWSPDGTRLLLSVLEPRENDEGFSYRIHEIGVDGSGFRPLTPGPRDYWTSWSPDGTRIAFASRQDGNLDVYTMAPDGSDWKRLTDAREEDTHPQWSPDGTRIAFVSRRGGTPAIWTMSADGSGQRRVGADGTREEGVGEEEVWNPVWSPDGRRLAFYETDAAGADHVWVMDADGSERRLLASGVWPGWSPDGSRILFAGSDGLHSIGADGTDRRRLVEGDVFFGRYSPDGAWIGYLATDSGGVSVNLVRPDGSGHVTLLRRPKPAW